MEQMGELRKSEERTRLMYEVVAWGSAITMVAVFIYGAVTAILNGLDVVGSSLVNVEFPFTFMAKPASYLMVASVTFVYSSMQLWRNRIARWSIFRLSLLQMIAIVVAVSSAYEILYNFMLWGAFLSNQLLTSSLSASNLVNNITSPGPVPWNLVFATKIFVALFAISGYVTYFMRRVHRPTGLSTEL